MQRSLAATLGFERERRSTTSDATADAVSGAKSYRYHGSSAATLINRCAELRRALRDVNTAVIGDTIDFETLSVYELGGTSLNPANVFSSLGGNGVYYHLWVAVKRTLEGINHISKGDEVGLTQTALERVLVELGISTSERVAGGPHFTFVDPRQHSDSSAMLKNARRLASLFAESGVNKDKVVISIPATEAGVTASKELEQEGICTNLILVSGLMHAAACAEANATALSISVGPLLDWHERKQRKPVHQNLSAHPGVQTVQATAAYFKLHSIKTKLIGTDFRELSEIAHVGELDAVSLSKEQIEILRWSPLSLVGRTEAASLRARQAQYPTVLLQTKGGFMSSLSAETRSLVAATMYGTLGKMKVQMEALQEVVEAEVIHQIRMKSEKLATLYEPPTHPSTPVKRRTKKRVRKSTGDAAENAPSKSAQDVDNEREIRSQNQLLKDILDALSKGK